MEAEAEAAEAALKSTASKTLLSKYRFFICERFSIESIVRMYMSKLNLALQFQKNGNCGSSDCICLSFVSFLKKRLCCRFDS